MNACFLSALCAALVLIAGGAAAGPLEELRAASSLDGLDAARLKAGEIVAARGTNGGNFLHGVYIESCFFVKRPLAAVGAALVQWDPSKHPEDEVAAYTLFRTPAAADFGRVAKLKPEHRPDRWMLDQAAAVRSGKASDLHLTAAEAAAFRQEAGGASAAWERTLRARTEAAASGGLAGANFRAGEVTISAEKEWRGLLGMAPKIAARFDGVTNPDPTAGGERWYYADRSLSQGHTSFSLGTITAQASADRWQIMDCTYYPSDTYYLSADLYYLWAWEGGTLVWQVDLVSAPFRAFTQGLDKVFAGREMVKETAKSIESFRKAIAP